jgi:hypothetical protein
MRVVLPGAQNIVDVLALRHDPIFLQRNLW